MKSIYLVRHGESEGNLDSSVYDQKPDSEIELTELGKIQAFQLGDALKEESKNATFICSPFRRAMQTMLSFGALERKIFLSNSITEMQWKSHFSDNLENSSLKKFLSEDGYHYKFPNGESGEEVYSRALDFKDYLLDLDKKGEIDENVFIFSHGMFIQLLLIALCGESDECNFKNFQTTYLRNCDYHTLIQEDFKFELKK